MQTYNFIFDETITCGAVLSGFELCQALRKLCYEANIISRKGNKELEDYFGIQPMKLHSKPKGIDITFTPKIRGDWAYIRTRDDRWKTHTERKIAVSEYIADWIGTDIILGNGTHERFKDLNINRDIDVLICGNYEPNKNIKTTVEEARKICDGKIVWFGRYTTEISGVETISSPSIEEIPRLYNRAKTFISMSRDEGWGRPVAEAIACGVPKVLNFNGGNRKVEVVSWESIAKQFIQNIC